MTLAAGVLTALLRAIVVGALACAAAHPIAAMWRTLPRGRARVWITALLLTPLLTPALVVGYAYGSLWALAVRLPWANETLYATLLVMRLTPVAAGILLLTPPPPIGDASLFIRQIAPPASSVHRASAAWSFLIRSRARAVMLAFLAVFLLSFSDLEMANLFHASAGLTASAYSWTIWQFDEQHQYPSIGESLRTIAAPVAIQLSVLLAGAALVIATRGRPRLEQARGQAGPRWRRAFAWAYMFIALLVSSIAPMSIVIANALRGIKALERDAVYFDGLQWSLLYAAAATAVAGSLAWRLLKLANGEPLLPRFPRARRAPSAVENSRERQERVPRSSEAQAVPTHNDRSKTRPALRWTVAPDVAQRGVPSPGPSLAGRRVSMARIAPLVLLCVPGLMGSIVLAILVQALFQWRGLNFLYDTPVKLIVGQSLWLLPAAVLLGWVARAATDGSAIYAARLLRGSSSARARRTSAKLRWRYRGLPVAIILALLFTWVYYEVILATFLHPNGGQPLIVLIYNWMHFRQSLVLSAMVCVMVATPIAIVAVAAGLIRLIMAANERGWTLMGSR